MWYWISSSIYWLVKLFNGDWHNMTSNIHYALPNNMVNYTYHQSSYHIWKLSEQRPQRNCIHKVQLYWICMMTFKSYNSYKNHWIKMAWYNMINYTSWPIILPNMKVIGPTNSEELHSQSETGQTNQKTICPHTVIVYRAIKIQIGFHRLCPSQLLIKCRWHVQIFMMDRRLDRWIVHFTFI